MNGRALRHSFSLCTARPYALHSAEESSRFSPGLTCRFRWSSSMVMAWPVGYSVHWLRLAQRIQASPARPERKFDGRGGEPRLCTETPLPPPLSLQPIGALLTNCALPTLLPAFIDSGGRQGCSICTALNLGDDKLPTTTRDVRLSFGRLATAQASRRIHHLSELEEAERPASG